jgi:polyisoprenoid-binding protein YceI
MRRPASLALAILVGASAPLSAQSTPKTAPSPVRFVLAPGSSEARYLVRELLAANTIENDVTGRTNAVRGSITLDPESGVVPNESKIVIDLTTLKTDKSRRDGYVQRRTLETAQYPNAELVVREIKGLPATLPHSGPLTLTLIGDLTLHGVTKATTWAVRANATPAGLTGTASTTLRFAAFGIDVPRVPVVARVDDPITLQLDFAFQRQDATSP